MTRVVEATLNENHLLFIYTFTPTAVPEPPTLLLVLSALGAIGVVFRVRFSLRGSAR
jgi:PEP-CTERM motif